jgi:hypothetical protein
LTFNFVKLEPLTTSLLVRQTLRTVMFADAIVGFVLSASAARAGWHERDGGWHGHDRGWHDDWHWYSHDRDWHHDRNWHGDRDWHWHGGAFWGVPAPVCVAPPCLSTLWLLIGVGFKDWHAMRLLLAMAAAVASLGLGRLAVTVMEVTP